VALLGPHALLGRASPECVRAGRSLVAFWVGQGNLRVGTIATNEERSNFVLVRFGEHYQAP
jgi:hypothetical protein